AEHAPRRPGGDAAPRDPPGHGGPPGGDERRRHPAPARDHRPVSASEADARRGTIGTFYSYKGGTGRSMAVAHVRLLLGSAGARVRVVDWDLEAPGLRRFFHRLLLDADLRSSRGLMDLLWDYALAAMTPAPDDLAADWHVEYADVLRYAVAVEWAFPQGCLHL